MQDPGARLCQTMRLFSMSTGAGATDLVDIVQGQSGGDEDEMNAGQHRQPVGRRLIHEGAQVSDQLRRLG